MSNSSMARMGAPMEWPNASMKATVVNARSPPERPFVSLVLWALAARACGVTLKRSVSFAWSTWMVPA